MRLFLQLEVDTPSSKTNKGQIRTLLFERHLPICLIDDSLEHTIIKPGRILFVSRITPFHLFVELFVVEQIDPNKGCSVHFFFHYQRLCYTIHFGARFELTILVNNQYTYTKKGPFRDEVSFTFKPSVMTVCLSWGRSKFNFLNISS